MAAVGESQLQRIIKDLHDAVVELAKEYREGGEPITDDSSGLHKLSFKLEYLLQFDQKEKATFLGTRKDYWDYFSDCLSKIRGANDGIRFVKSIPELKTSLGKGRALIRYSLVHQRLADTLQQCLMNKRITSDWYYARSPFLKPHLSADIISHLYELNEVQFDVASRGHDLDASWPTFARRTLGMANSPSHMWTAPSRSSSVSSLASCYSQQAHECPLSPDYGHGLLDDLNESLPTSGNEDSAVEDLRLELDQSELKHRDLLDRVQQLAEEAAELRGVVVELQRQLDASLAAQEEQQGLQRALEALQGKEEELRRELPALRTANSAQEAEQRHLQERLSTAEGKNLELMAKLDGVLDEKGQQAASHFDSAQKIHELLDRLKDAERGKIEAVAEMEETKKQAQRTAAELRDREAMEGEAEKKLGMLTRSSAEERTLLESKVAEQSSTVEKLQAALTVKDEEASRLQKQLEDLQRSLENEARKAQEATQQAHKERDTHQRTMGQLKESTEEALCSLKEQLSSRETELISGTRRLQQAEARSEALSEERDGLSVSLREQRAGAAELAKKLCDYETRCASLVELNEQMLGASKRNEKLQEDLVKSRVALEAEMATLSSSEKQLRGQLDDSKVTVDEKEKRLREENRRLDESFQRATMAAEMTGAASKQLEKENQSLREEQAAVKTALGTMQAELKAIHSNIGELERSLGESRKSEASLQEQLQANEALLDRKEKDCAELEAAVKTLKGREKQLEAACAQQATLAEKVTAESSARANESLEASSRLGVVEGLLDVSMKEVARHQAAVLALQIQLQRSGEEKAKAQAGLDATEVQRDELRTLSEQLHAELKEVNQSHVADLLQCKEREAAARAELAVSEAASRDELSALKAQNERLSLEGSETRDGLHRANTEMAELGMTICRLTAEKEEAQERRAEDAARIEELEECTAKELALLEDSVAALRQENAGLKDKLLQTEALTGTLREVQEKLETAEGQLTMFRDSSREEVEAIKFQMSSESMNHQTQIKSMSEELACVKATLQMELEKVSSLEVKVSELEGVNEKYSRLIVEKDSHITRSEATIRHGEGEVQQLRYSVTSTEEAFLAVQKSHEELKQKLNEAELEKQSNYLKMTSEIDDLCRTKTILEERLIELIKDKDALWQKSDALEFEQKLRAEENWWLVDKEATHCLSCQGQFTWWLRRHHCRLCGRIFCYYCSNHQAMFKHSGKKERCCRECYSQHSAVVEKEAELSPSDTQPTPPAEGPPSSPAPAPCRPTPRAAVSDPNNRSEEGAYDIITEEEVNGVYDSDSMSQTTRGSLEGEPDRRHPGSLDIGTGENLDDPEEHVPTIQDAEINLLQSGEATLVVPLTIEDICTFGDGSRELFVKSSCYSVLAIAVADHGPTINWVFSSEPRSISFSVVYREAQDTPVEQSKVLIPLMRCSSHKETIQGQLKVRNPGLYTLIFDNSFSRFISKKVLYRLTMEQPIIYDGTDFP